MRTSLIVAGLLPLLSACGAGGGDSRGAAARRPGAAAAFAAADSVVLERTACANVCPAYRVSVAASGQVMYHSHPPGGGKERVAFDSVAPDAAARLLAAAAAAGVFALPDTVESDRHLCPSSATDSPWAIVTVFGPAGAKGVVDYLGCYDADNVPGPGTPRALAPLRAYEGAIDSVAGAARLARASFPLP